MENYAKDGHKDGGLSGCGLGPFDGLLGCVMKENGEVVTMPFIYARY
jgi:hypothetical protein